VFKILKSYFVCHGLWLLLLLLPINAPSAGFAQSISFDPSDTIPTDPDFEVIIAIDCVADLVKGIELSASYDPNLVQLNSITAGPWYTGSGQSFYFFDYTNLDPAGSIHFASAVLDGTLGGNGVLAICNFSVLSLGVSPLDFIDLSVRDADNFPLAFNNSTGDQITIDPAVTEEGNSFGTIKAIYR